MAFPDFGPLEQIAKLTQDGFAQGSFLFKMFAGEISSMYSLHFVGLTFAMIGAVAIVFIKNFHNAKTILSWTFIVFVLLIGPRNYKAFFSDLNINYDPSTYTINNNNTNSDVKAYTPQAFIVDFMSKLHHAVYLGFFDISDPQNPKIYNALEAVTTTGVATKPENTTLTGNRPDILQEIQIYGGDVGLKCGNPSNLAYPLYDKEWADSVKNLTDSNNQSNTPIKIESSQLSAQDTFALQQKYFKLGDMQNLINMYGANYSHIDDKVMAPFAVITIDKTENKDIIKQTLINSGVSENNAEEAALIYKESKSEELETYLGTLTYLMMRKDKEPDGLGYDQDGLIEDIKTDTDLEKIWPSTLTVNSPAISVYLKDSSAFDDVGAILGDGDPAEMRLQSSHHAEFMKKVRKCVGSGQYAPQQCHNVETEEMTIWKNQIINNKNRYNTSIGLALITPKIKEIYKDRAKQSINDKPTRDISNLAKNPYLNVIYNCAQLHFLIRNHIKDALLFQNVWPNHNNIITYKNGKTQPTLAFGKKGGFDIMVSGTGKEYLEYPYLRKGTHLNTYMQSLSDTMQKLANIQYLKKTATGEYKNIDALSHGNDKEEKVAAEFLRRYTIVSLINKSFDITLLPKNAKGSNASTMKANIAKNIDNSISDSTKGIRTQLSGEGVKKNINNIGVGLLGWAAEKLSSIATKIGAEFAGMGAIAYIQFLKLFVGLSLYFVLMCTPILYMMGLIVPSHAPGVIIISLIVPLALKAIPITYTLVDAMFTSIMLNKNFLSITELDSALLIYAAAGAYTSITMITFFLLFKAGDVSTVLGQISNMDSKANEAADAGVKMAKVLGSAAVMAVTAGAGGAIGGIASGKGIKGSLANAGKGALRQGGEVFGKHGLAAIPGAGNAFQEITGSYREGKGQGKVLNEVRSDNAERRERGEEELSLRKRINMAEDVAAYKKYKAPVDTAADYEAAVRAEEKGEAAAKVNNTSLSKVRHENREQRALDNINQELGAGSKNLELKDVQVEMNGVKLDATTARAMQMGKDQADRIVKQADPEVAAQARAREILAEAKKINKQEAANKLSGKETKDYSPVQNTEEIKDSDGNVIGSRTKSSVNESSLTRVGDVLKGDIRKNNKDITDAAAGIAAEKVAIDEMNKYNNANIEAKKATFEHFTPEMIAEIKANPEANKAFESMVSKGTTGDLRVRSDQKELYKIANKYTDGGAGGVDINMFEAVMKNNMQAKKDAATSAKGIQREVNKILAKDKAQS